MEPEWNHSLIQSDADILGLRSHSIYLSLNNNIDCMDLCQKTKNLIDGFIAKNNSLQDAVLCIEIKKIAYNE